MKIITKNKVKVKKNIQESFTGKNLTGYGGIGLFKYFIDRLKIREEFNSNIMINRKVRRYTIGDFLISLIYMFVIGYSRQSDIQELNKDHVFKKLIGYIDLPDQSVISRLFSSLLVGTATMIYKVGLKLLNKIRKGYRDLESATLDIDSHVTVCYGNQQRASVGYNPKKPGRKSYHPLLCFISETKDFLHGKFRTGKIYTAKNCSGFLRACLKLLPGTLKRIYVRADSGFFDQKFIEELEKKVTGYAISVKQYTSVQRYFDSIEYKKLSNGLYIGEFNYE
jgi:hypothetical protein